MASPKASKKSPPARGGQKKSDLQAKSTATSSRNIRETVESVAIAFILAFLFRTFEAEAFVIPTGSMAPTLQGQHKDVECVKCGYRFQLNASQEEGNAAEDGSDIVAGTCPQCRYTLTLDATAEAIPGRSYEEITFGAQQATYPGDRILVGKFVYDFVEPNRWDVVVFKYPGDTKMNYIKRLVGLPGEDIHIRHGDIYVRPAGSDEKLQIARKPPNKQLAMMQMVYDTNFTSSELFRKRWPMRWQQLPREAAPDAGSWQMVEFTPQQLEKVNVRPTFTIDGSSDEERWLRYQHFVPSYQDWEMMAAGSLGENYSPRPQLITDFYAYNTSLSRLERNAMGTLAPDTRRLGLHWVGDLMIEADIEVKSAQGELLFDLVKGGIHFTCRVDVATGEATLESTAAELKDFSPRAKTALQGPGSFSIRFSNVDQELRLWVDNKLIEFDAPTTFELNIMRPESTPHEPGDLAPAGIGSRGVALRVNAIQLWRDIYYIADSHEHNGPGAGLSDFPFDARPVFESLSPEEYAKFLSDPNQWEVYTKRRAVSFMLEKDQENPARDQFFMLGDNSPFSKDSRLWPDPSVGLKYYVERPLLIGEALVIYWPHPWNRIPGTSIPFPYFPNFGDMGLVR